ncbi:MAG: pitrilysin family protein [Candidatus Omnitrophota bacterium]|jgi:predicted Zn-dependent peptidase
MNYILNTLANGVRVVTVPMRERTSASVAVWVRTGSRYESEKAAGISHMLEHMVFKGTETRTTRQIKQEVEGVGGMLNAYTAEESTCYFAKLLREHYPKALDVLADMVNHATIVSSEFERERGVILEEIKMYRDQPSHYVHELIGELLWPHQAIGRPISGSIESVSAMKRSDVLEYRDRYYRPKNFLVAISGGVHPEDVVPRVEALFSAKEPGQASSFEKAISRQSGPRTHFLLKDTEQTHFVVGLHGLARSSPHRYPLGLLNVILGANMSSRLFEEVREKRGLAYEIRSGLHFFDDTGAFTVSAGVETAKAPQAMAVIMRELGKVCRKPVSEQELRRAKDYFISQLSMALEDTLEHLLWVGEYALCRQKLPDCDKIRANVEAVTAVQIQQIAVQLFRTANLNLALIGPVKAALEKKIRAEFEIPV